MMKEITLFLAYCSDSEDLKEIVFQVINEINDYISGFYHTMITVKEWKHSTYAGMGNAEQQILAQMPPDRCNIFVGIVRYRFGSPTGNINPDTGEIYLSGMEEEFCCAYRTWEKNRTPHIMVFKSSEPIPREHINEEQIRNINNYFSEFRPDGRYPGIYREFGSKEAFESEFRKNIILLLNKILPSNHSKEQEERKPVFEHIFRQDTNTERNQRKAQEISKGKELKLFAKTGISFLEHPSLFNQNVYTALNQGASFKVIILNPWSPNGIYTALCEEVNYRRLNKRVLQEFLSDKLNAEKVIEHFEKSEWYSKYKRSISGYENMRVSYRDKVELRMTNLDSEASIFLTETCCFYEPYLNSTTVSRPTLPLFEVVIKNDDPIYDYISKYFDSIWETAYRFSSYDENRFKELMKLYYNAKYTKRSKYGQSV
jgi:hypothetical protein